MTDITVSTTSFQVEKRSWLIPQPGGIGAGFTQSIVLDVSMFTSGTHYPNGYFLSGLNLARITGTGQGGVIGLYGPYDDAATDGRQTLAGHLFSATKVPNLADTTKDVGAALLSAFAVVKLSKLPIALDANGQVDGKANFIYYIA
jgi:hypothetical protein